MFFHESGNRPLVSFFKWQSFESDLIGEVVDQYFLQTHKLIDTVRVLKSKTSPQASQIYLKSKSISGNRTPAEVSKEKTAMRTCLRARMYANINYHRTSQLTLEPYINFNSRSAPWDHKQWQITYSLW